MANIEKRSISLSSELAGAIDGAVASGEYGNASEVVREALREWKAKRELHGRTVQELRRLWDEGITSGDAGDFDFDELKSAARGEAERRRSGKG